MVDGVMILGLAAGFLATGAMVPQVVKVWKTKQTRDLSLATFLMIDLGVGLWLVYGILIREVPVIAANLVGVLLLTSIVIAKLRYG
jgi:MtN3 and saliva related transmembrane protein